MPPCRRQSDRQHRVHGKRPDRGAPLACHRIANARADAEAMAKAVGGSLGPLAELSTERPQQGIFPRAGGMAATAAAAPAGVETPITPREILVEAVVFARWQFTPARQ
jgi:uncharacterized protein YggE